jgi:hypothetical protein
MSGGRDIDICFLKEQAGETPKLILLNFVLHHCYAVPPFRNNYLVLNEYGFFVLLKPTFYYVRRT